VNLSWELKADWASTAKVAKRAEYRMMLRWGGMKIAYIRNLSAQKGTWRCMRNQVTVYERLPFKTLDLYIYTKHKAPVTEADHYVMKQVIILLLSVCFH
jgi:hypothetical protein